jgi:hypothetical protein
VAFRGVVRLCSLKRALPISPSVVREGTLQHGAVARQFATAGSISRDP